MDQGGNERDLELDLLAPQRGRAGQARNLAEGPRDLLCGFDQRRLGERPLSSRTP